MEVIEKKWENIIMLIASAYMYIVIVSLTSGSCNLKRSDAPFKSRLGASTVKRERRANMFLLNMFVVGSNCLINNFYRRPEKNEILRVLSE